MMGKAIGVLLILALALTLSTCTRTTVTEDPEEHSYEEQPIRFTTTGVDDDSPVSSPDKLVPDRKSYYAYLPSGPYEQRGVLEAVLESPMTVTPPVRLEPDVTPTPTPLETFVLENATGKPGHGDTGNFHSVAGAYIALRVNSSDHRVARLHSYDRETFIYIISSGDKYILGNLTRNICIIRCSTKHQITMYYTSDAFEYLYYLVPKVGYRVEVVAAKKPASEDTMAKYRLWTNDPHDRKYC